MLRILRRLSVIAMIAACAITAFGYAGATRTPEVRETAVSAPNWPAGEPPLRILLLSDTHVAGPDMPPDRLAAIVAQVNALQPDLILIAGDFIGDRILSTRFYPAAESVAPLAGLRARLGVAAVLGNHDHWDDAAAVRTALEQAGIRILVNDAVRAGPLVVGGLDDDHSGHADLPRTLARMQALGGVPVMLSHSPDPFPDLPRGIPLMVAGHTHCGQIDLPFYGRLATASRYGERYACGRIDEAGRTLIVSAGLGASVLPLRIGAPPDLWLITLGR